MPGPSSRLLPLLLATLVALAAGIACGQGEPAGYHRSLYPAINHADLKLLVRELKLDEGQQIVAETLLEDYRTAFTEGVGEVRATLQTLPRDEGIPRDEKRGEQMRIREEIRVILEEAQLAAAQEPDAEARAGILAEAEEQVHVLRNQLRELSVGERDHDEVVAAMTRMREAVAAWQPRSERLYQDFIANLQALLEEEQVERWPAAERHLRRSKSIRDAELSGESVDLIALVEPLSLDAKTRETLAPMLEAYAVRLDEALEARETFLRERSADRAAAVELGDAEEAERLYREELELRKTVRSVNDEYAPMIAELLPDEHCASWLASVREAADTRIYRTTRVERLLEAAATLEGLEQETEEAVRELRESHRVTLDQMNERLRATVRALEPEQFLQRRLRRFQTEESVRRRAGSSSEVDLIQAAFEERRVMEDQFADRLQLVLTPELFQRLPGARASRGAAAGSRGRGLDGQELMKRFDADGDGRLDEEERTALRDYLRQQRGGGE